MLFYLYLFIAFLAFRRPKHTYLLLTNNIYYHNTTYYKLIFTITILATTNTSQDQIHMKVAADAAPTRQERVLRCRRYHYYRHHHYYFHYHCYQ